MNIQLRMGLVAAGLAVGLAAWSANFSTTGTPDQSAPTLTQSPSTSVQGGRVQIGWSTNEVADSRVYFGTSSDAMLKVAGDIDYTQVHQVKLPDLEPGITYFYQVVSVDPAGNTFTSAIGSFVAPNSTPTLTVGKSGNGSGTITGTGIHCGDDCVESYASGTAVSLSAAPATGSGFSGWTPTSCANAFNINANTLCTAAFTLNRYTLTVNTSGTGTGTVSGGGTFDYNTSVTPGAVATAGSTFAGWSPSSCGSAFPLTSNTTCTAIFNEIPVSHQLTVSVSGSGSVLSDPAGISCSSANCNAYFNKNTKVLLTATPAAGYYFTGWSNGCFGKDACSVTMDAAKTVTATFSQSPANTVNLTVIKTGKGKVSGWDGTGINCGAVCKYPYPKNTLVKLEAKGDTGNTFMTWAGACLPGKGYCEVMMTGDLTVTADFKNTYLLILPAIQLLLE